MNISKTTTNTRGVSEAHLREWAERHGLDGWSLTDLRCAFEDATSMEVTIPTASWRVAGHMPEDARRYAKHLREIHCAHVRGWGVMADMLDAYAATLSAQPAERVPEGWREAFEDCYMRANEVGILHRDDDGEYTSAFTKVAWALWNERACLSPIYWWHASRDDDALTWTVHSPSGDSCEVHERAAGAHAEILRQLAQDLTASPAPSDGGKGVEG